MTWKIAEKLIGKPSTDPDFKKQFDFVQFHPSYDYTDFVEGLRPEESGSAVIFKRRDGIFKAFCDKAAKDPDNKYVFVIDEINRGEISKIFGELFFSIDPGYRGEFNDNGNDNKVKTQYQNLINENEQIETGNVDEAEKGQETEKSIPYSFDKGFYVPNNVFVIGTMNDIDRSVESMDFAFRRRFAFEEITAAESESMVYNKLGKPGWTDDIIREATDRMRSLNFAIVNSQIGGLTQQYQIGGSYFLKLEKLDFDFQRLWDVFLKGVIYEYYRGQPDAFEKLSQLEDAFNLVDGKGKKNATK